METIQSQKKTLTRQREQFETSRLLLDPLTKTDVSFIYDLLNSEGWVRFIGDRNIRSTEDATSYIQKITANPNVQYWVVRLKVHQIPIGIITLIQRDYLPQPDLGFAFLPSFAGKGYAHEAATAVLQFILSHQHQAELLATTIKENQDSIALLLKLGFSFKKEIVVDAETIQLYGISNDLSNIHQLIATFFASFTNTNDQKPNLDILHSICHPDIIIIKNTNENSNAYNLHSFIEPRKKILNDGSLIDFEEKEIWAETHMVKNMAQRRSTYEKTGILNGNPFDQKGHKLFQMIKTDQGWKITSMIWQDE